MPLHRHGYSPIQRLCQYILFTLKAMSFKLTANSFQGFKHGTQPMQSAYYQPIIKLNMPHVLQEQGGNHRL